MRQSVISIASNTTRRSNSVLHGIDSAIRFAVRNGRDSAVNPSMTKSSKMNCPRQR
jgi:hypothetical protein